MISPLARLVLILATASAAEGAETARYFESWHADGARIAPDGRHVAYFRSAGRRSEVVIVDCDHPETIAAVVLSGSLSRATKEGQESKGGKGGGAPGGGGGKGGKGGGGMGSQGGQASQGYPGSPRSSGAKRPEDEVQRLQWASAGEVQALSRAGEWWSVTVAGKATRLKDAPKPLPEPAAPAGAPGAADPSAPMQAALEAKFPDRTVQIAGWDDARQRAVILVTSPEDAGRFFLYDREFDRLTEFIRRTPQLQSADLARVQPFSGTAGPSPLAAAVTAEPRLPPPRPLPVVIVCRPAASSATPLHFEPELHALVSAGYAVVEFSPVGAALPSADALDDTLAAVLQRFPFNSSRVAVLGLEGGTRLAEQLAARHPNQIQCLATIDEPFSLFHSSGAAPSVRLKTENGRLAPAYVSAISFFRQQL